MSKFQERAERVALGVTSLIGVAVIVYSSIAILRDQVVRTPWGWIMVDLHHGVITYEPNPQG